MSAEAVEPPGAESPAELAAGTARLLAQMLAEEISWRQAREQAAFDAGVREGQRWEHETAELRERERWAGYRAPAAEPADTPDEARQRARTERVWEAYDAAGYEP